MSKRKLSNLSLVFGLLLFVAAVPAEGRVAYKFDEIQTEWKKVFPQDKPFLDTVHEKYLARGGIFSEGEAPKNQTSLGGLLAGNASSTAARTIYFPVKNFDGESLELVLRVQSRVQLLKTTLQAYIGIRDDTFNTTGMSANEAAQVYEKRRLEIEARQTSVNLELFAATMANYVRAENLAHRCSSYLEGKKLADELGFNRADKPKPVAAWQSFYTKLNDFYLDDKTGFKKIPVEICELSVVNSRADTLRHIQAGIDEKLSVTMQEALEGYQTILESKLQELGSRLQESELNIPTRGLFALEKAYKDTFDLMDLVKKDLLGLYSTDSGLPLLAQLDRQIQQMNTKSTEEGALDFINNFRQKYEGLMAKLVALPDTKGLNPDSQKQLAPCRLLAQIPNAQAPTDELKAFQNSYNACLVATAKVYTEMKAVKKDEPKTLKFAEALGVLLQSYKDKIK